MIARSMFQARLAKWLPHPLVSLLPRLQTDKADQTDIYFCYRLLLGRQAEPEGWTHWSQRVASGMMASQLVKAFIETREFRQKQLLKAKTRIALDDFVLYVNPNDSAIADVISQHQAYEPHVTAVLKQLLKPEHVFLDVGCNIGWFALVAASIVGQGKVIGVEPNWGNLQLIYQSISENEFQNIVIFPYAATDRRKLLQLSGHAAYGFVHAIENSDADYIQGVALDEILRDEPRLDIIKMDIEGHEPVALEGMRQIIQKHRPMIVSEFHPKLIRDFAKRDPQAYLQALVKLGYKLAVIDWEGRTRDVDEPAQVMNYWSVVNQQHGTGDTMHLDILARPSNQA